MAKEKSIYDGDNDAEVIPKAPVKVSKEEFTTEEVFKAGQFKGVRMTHVESGVNIFRELRRGQTAPTTEMKVAIKKMLNK